MAGRRCYRSIDFGEMIMRFWVLLLLLGGVAGCTNIGDDARYKFGVSADNGAALPGGQGVLAWKAGQLCTGGQRVVRHDVVKTEEGGEIADDQLQCDPYRPSIDLAGFSWLTAY